VTDVYDPTFFDRIAPGCQRSARHVVPEVMRLIRPATVVDVGCGEGHWAAVFEALGADVVGIDGAHVRPERVLVSRFVTADLEQGVPRLGRFDLAVSLEVAEHLSPAGGDRLIEGLAGCADTVLFSAAIPGQGGDGHINEQPHQYWIDRLVAHGFVVDERWRERFAAHPGVEWWYRQNLLLARRPVTEAGS
jgi:SAM-dependent methyltransferase